MTVREALDKLEKYCEDRIQYNPYTDYEQGTADTLHKVLDCIDDIKRELAKD